MPQQTASASLRLAAFVLKKSSFPPGATVFDCEDKASQWESLLNSTVFKCAPGFVNNTYGNWVHPVNHPENSFFIPDDFFTREFFKPTTQPIERQSDDSSV